MSHATNGASLPDEYNTPSPSSSSTKATMPFSSSSSSSSPSQQTAPNKTRYLKPNHSLIPAEEAERKAAEALYAAAADAASDAASIMNANTHKKTSIDKEIEAVVAEEGRSFLSQRATIPKITTLTNTLPTPSDWSVSSKSTASSRLRTQKIPIISRDPNDHLFSMSSVKMKLEQLLRQTRTNWCTSLSSLFIVILLGATVQLHTNDLPSVSSLSSSSSATSTADAATGPRHSALSILHSAYNAYGFNVKLSKSLQYLADLEEPRGEGDVPFFFHVPRSGGSTLKDIMGSCLGMVMASDVGARHGHKYDKFLQIMEDEKGSKFVNVDTTTAEGIHRAKNLNLVESGLADVIVTQHLHPAATMFNEQQRGRMFTIMRHPIERAVSLFHYLGVADWEPTYDPDLAFISIEMYARSKRIEHNWVVRFLSNELERDLTEKHLEVAKEVLRKKCIVGLLSEKGESFDRFERYFGWTFPDEESRACHERFLHDGWSNQHNHPTVAEGSTAWELLSKINDLDMQLYEYAQELFREQAALFVDQPEDQPVDQQQQVQLPPAAGAAAPNAEAGPSAEEVVLEAMGKKPAAQKNHAGLGGMPQPPDGNPPQNAPVQS